MHIGTATTWTSVTAGELQSFAMRSDGTLWGWGYNGTGLLGDGSNTNRLAPVQVGAATNWTTVAAGGDHTVATRTDGTLWAWGANNDSQLGDGGTTSTNAPGRIGSATNWKSVVRRVLQHGGHPQRCDAVGLG